ncbi:MAG: GTP-binding protein [Acidimicrobiia bacterium]|nr:GTP-binding protein [Acidimicrobiia bacterium]
MTVDRAGTEELLAGFQTVTSTLAAARRAAAAGDQPAGAEHPVPVTLLTGFLGSGKTTVLRQLLTADHGLRITAIVNDLGSVNVDGGTLGAAALPAGGAERLELTNGCACCALSDELSDSLHGALAADRRPDAVIIEASGAADAVAMAATIEAEPLSRLDGIVGLVDAEAWSAQLAHPVVGRLVRRQVQTAHVVLLSKVDLVDPTAVDEIVAAIGAVAPGRRVVPITRGVVEPALLLDAAVHGAALRPPAEAHEAEFATRTVRLHGPLDIARLFAWLESDHRLLRAKGWFLGPDDESYELQVVGRRWTLVPLATAPDASLVLIADDPAIVDEAARAVASMA